jgi:protein SCO1/2
MVRLPLIAVIVWVLAVILMACGSQDNESLPLYDDIPPFSLTDQMGNTFTNEDLLGKVVLANSVFANCTEFCPTLSPRMAQIQSNLEADGFSGSEVLLLSFTVDPEHDTPEILLSYAERYGANHDGWRFLTGPPDVMRRVITDGLKLGFGQVEQRNEHHHEDGSLHIHEYDVYHTNRVVLGDREGRVRAYYDGALDWDMAQVLDDVHRLLE